jgi:hypothetical protein
LPHGEALLTSCPTTSTGCKRGCRRRREESSWEGGRLCRTGRHSLRRALQRARVASGVVGDDVRSRLGKWGRLCRTRRHSSRRALQKARVAGGVVGDDVRSRLGKGGRLCRTGMHSSRRALQKGAGCRRGCRRRREESSWEAGAGFAAREKHSLRRALQKSAVLAMLIEGPK